MSLKDSFYQNSTGLLQQEQTAFNAGSTLVGTGPGVGSYDVIAAALQSNAALGLTKFTINVPVTYNPAALRGNNGNNLILKAFLAGVQSGLATQSIFDYECTPVLNTSDTLNTSLDLNFTF
jgi:hypothetical protein